MKIPKINKDKLYKVEWVDIAPFNWKHIEDCPKPCPSYSIGNVFVQDDVVLVINGGNEDNEFCGDSIPMGCITLVKEL